MLESSGAGQLTQSGEQGHNTAGTRTSGAVAIANTHALMPMGSPGRSLLVRLAPGQPDLLMTLKRS